MRTGLLRQLKLLEHIDVTRKAVMGRSVNISHGFRKVNISRCSYNNVIWRGLNG